MLLDVVTVLQLIIIVYFIVKVIHCRCYLNKAVFRFCNLNGVKMRGANLTEAMFANVGIESVDFSGTPAIILRHICFF